ncbi:hypothetical protein C9I43_00490 (plasmid) [Shewanella morhuae]|uniref:Uncharacterized protein n=2 Tax=Shewanellaceae TaxID=267890 RepID=A0ABX5HY82_9GAMM|nr:hypothetical protein [Shewanella morhuae]PTA51847.1 hypothetical protein C9I43_00490 [Shewanella morhuae]
MSSDNLLMKKQQIDPFSASFSSLLVIVFSKSNSKNFPLALNIAQGAEKFVETTVSGKTTYSVCFGGNQVDAARAIAFLDYAASWKGVQIFSQGKLIPSSYHIVEVLNCYLKSQSCRDYKAHCQTVIDDPFNTEIEKIGGIAFVIKITETPTIKQEIEIDRYAFPCKHIFHRFRFQCDHPSCPEDQIQAKAVDLGCDWCPNFDADSWKKIGTKTVLKEFFEQIKANVTATQSHK